jgi:RNA polymerase sigma factor (sigma-70 family)
MTKPLKRTTGRPISVAMTAEPIPPEQAPNQAFERLAEPFRRELKLHCYRMLGSVHEAEDLVQETFLRAWRNFASFEERGSFRAWLYRIATNACLNALASRKSAQRFLPDQRLPATAGMPDGTPAMDVAWLEPYPDSNLEGIADDAPNPEARYASREAVQLAFIAAIPMDGRRSSRSQIKHSKSYSAAICGPGKGLISTVLSRSSKRMRPTPCRRCRNGMRDARQSAASLRGPGRLMTAIA